MSCKSFTEKQLQEIVKLRAKGLQWKEISSRINQKYGLDKSDESVRIAYRRHSGAGPKPKAEPHPHADFTKKALGDIVVKKNVKKGRYFVTAVSADAEVDVPFFNAVKSYCKKTDAKLIILPMRSHVRPLKSQPSHYDPLLKPYLDCFATEYIFNKFLRAIEAHLNPQQTIPLTGLDRIRGPLEDFETPSKQSRDIVAKAIHSREKPSIIVASPKQMMETIPVGNSGMPRILHSTGALTKPDYLSNRIGMIAKSDHVIGGLVVEIEGDAFHLRQVQAAADGSFVELAKRKCLRYFPNGKTKAEHALGFKMGDIHCGQHDEALFPPMFDLWKITKPEVITLEDLMDGVSISHHLEGRNLDKDRRPAKLKTLDSELNITRSIVDLFKAKKPKNAKLIVTDANHNGHLYRYLNEGRYMKDDANRELAHRMVVQVYDGLNPLQERLDPKKEMVWLTENDDFWIEGVQMGAHGHLGLNGARGSKRSHDKSYGDAMVGHHHAPFIYHRVFGVGTHSLMRLGYNKGPSGWLPTDGLVFKGGQKMLVTYIKGKWHG